MIISLIGMSGSGKTYWAKKLEKIGYKRYSVDDLIGIKLTRELSRMEYHGLNGIARWMGQPYEAQYSNTSLTYLSLEEEAMETIFAFVRDAVSTERDYVIDATGSVIYLSIKILRKLKRLSKIIYFWTPKKAEKNMFDLYNKDLKPVIWGNIYQPRDGEDHASTLARCYPKLLAFRSRKYMELAHIKIDSSTLWQSSYTARELLASISDKLRLHVSRKSVNNDKI